MRNQRSLMTFRALQNGPTDPRKWSGQGATFFFTGNFDGGVATIEMSPDKEDWFDPADNEFTEQSVRTLMFGTGEWLRLNMTGAGGAVDVTCKVSGETTMGRG